MLTFYSVSKLIFYFLTTATEDIIKSKLFSHLKGKSLRPLEIFRKSTAKFT